MKIKEMERLTRHMDHYFGQSDSLVLHPIVDNGFHIDVLLYKPTERYPFWKLVTMGASDYKMPKLPHMLGRFNEYMMFVDKDEDLGDRDVVAWYYAKLMMIASYARAHSVHITYGDSIEWGNDDPESEMMAAYIEMPQIIPNTGVLRCKLGLFKTVICLQTILLNQVDLNQLKKIGPEAFSYYLYPEHNGKPHFLAEKHRSERF